MRKITLNGGPLNGRTFDVPEGVDRIDHHAAVDGWYDDEGRWNPDAHADLIVDPGGLSEFLGTGVPRLVREARIGRRVLLVARTRKRAVELWGEALPLATDALKVRTANGTERITFPTGGILVPVGLNSRGHRGVAADVVYLADGLTETDAADVLPALAGSTEPTVLHGDAE